MDNNLTLIRQSLIEFYPLRSSDEVLLIGSDVDEVLKLIKSRCNYDVVTSYEELVSAHSYDVIIVIDMYRICIDSDVEAATFLSEASSHRNDVAPMLLAMESKLGLRYFAGCEEEQFGGFFTGIEDYANYRIHPLSKKELEDAITACGISNYRFYYPYPDYKYPTIIYSDRSLPRVGELNRNIRNVDSNRYVLFDERRAYDSIIKAGLFSHFANSYLVAIDDDRMSDLVYTKYSTDRDRAYMTRTDKRICDGRMVISKVALFDEGRAHLAHMVSMCDKLRVRYADTMRITDVTMGETDPSVVHIEFADGTPLLDRVEYLLDTKDRAAIFSLIDDYYARIAYDHDGVDDFTITPEFTEVFGEADDENYYDHLESHRLMSASVTDVDMIFDNIIVADDGTWQLIDYEWTFDFPIPDKFVLYRTLWYYYNSCGIESLIHWNEMMLRYSIDHELEMSFRHMEVHLQEYISGGTMTIERIVAESDVTSESRATMIDKASFYEEGQFYRSDYRRLSMQQQATAKAYEDALVYKDRAEQLMQRYNNLQNLYISSEAQTQVDRVKNRLRRVRDRLRGKGKGDR